MTHVLKTSLLSLHFFLLIACGPRNSPPAVPPPIAATRFAGTSEIQTNSNLWTPLLTNQPIQPGSRLRTGTNSFLELTAISNPHRILLAHTSEEVIDRWVQRGAADEEIQIEVRQGLVLIDLPTISGSIFELKGSNFLASVRAGVRPGPTIAAINADGSVLVQAGTIACVLISAPNPPIGVIVNPGQMFDPVAKTAKRIPGTSNEVWNLLTQ